MYLLYCNTVINTFFGPGAIAEVNGVFVFHLNNSKKLCWLIFSNYIYSYFSFSLLRHFEKKYTPVLMTSSFILHMFLWETLHCIRKMLAPPRWYGARCATGSSTGGSQLFNLHSLFIMLIQGDCWPAGHRKYSGILENILRAASLVKSAFSVSIFGQKIRHNSTIQWQVQFACLSALVLGRSVDRTWQREHGS